MIRIRRVAALTLVLAGGLAGTAQAAGEVRIDKDRRAHQRQPAALRVHGHEPARVPRGHQRLAGVQQR